MLIALYCTVQVWAVKLNRLFEEQNVGVLLGTMSLLLGIVSRSYQGYEPCVPKVRPVALCCTGGLLRGVGGGRRRRRPRQYFSMRPVARSQPGQDRPVKIQPVELKCCLALETYAGRGRDGMS